MGTFYLIIVKGSFNFEIIFIFFVNFYKFFKNVSPLTDFNLLLFLFTFTVMEMSLIKTATILRAHEYLIKSTKAFHRIVREISTLYGEWNLNLKPIKGRFLLTLCNHVSFRNFGFESILHSKYTSSPSLMSPA